MNQKIDEKVLRKHEAIIKQSEAEVQEERRRKNLECELRSMVFSDTNRLPLEQIEALERITSKVALGTALYDKKELEFYRTLVRIREMWPEATANDLMDMIDDSDPGIRMLLHVRFLAELT